MADPVTPNFGFTLPTVGGDADTWGGLNNGNWSGVDTALGGVSTSVAGVSSSLIAAASILAIAGTELINVSTSQTGVSTSLVSTAASLSQVSASLSSTNSGVTSVASSLGGVSTSVAGVSSSLAGVSGSLAGVSSSLTSVSASLLGASSSLAGVSTSLAALPQPGTNPNSAGYLGLPQTSISANHTLALTDLGTELFCTSNLTVSIPAHTSLGQTVGSYVKIAAASGVTVTVSITTDSLVLESSGSAGSRTITGRGHGVFSYEKTGEWWAAGVSLV